MDYCPYSPITLSYNSEVCDIYNGLFTEHYFDNNLGVSVGSFLYLDDLGNTVAPNGYYARINQQIIVVSGGTGEITEIRGCDTLFLGNYYRPPGWVSDDEEDGPDLYSKNGLFTLGEIAYYQEYFPNGGYPYYKLTRWYAGTGAISRNGGTYYAINSGIIGQYLYG